MPEPLPPLAPILERLTSQLDNAPGAGRLSRVDILVLAILAMEYDATQPFLVHPATCSIHERATWLRRCTCGLEAARSRSFTLRRRLVPPTVESPPDPRRRGKRQER
ncbi:MAG: hypothetical protein Q8P41_19045 [Pseudomonadota bacterium]|nr:hypothetical protein [Pseudomonadota bacterium]